MRRRPVVAGLIVGSVFAFLFAPIVLVVLFSFNGAASTSLPFTSFSTQWYQRVIEDPVFVTALQNSVLVALITTAIVVIVGTFAAFGLARQSSRLLDAVSALVMTPLMLPGLVIGIALLSFFSRLHVDLSLWTVVAGHCLVTVPFVVLIVNARLLRLDRSIEEAARDLGANQVQAFRAIVLPAILPSILGAALVSVAWSLDEFVITLFTNGGTTTVPVLIYSNVRQGIEPSINATAAMVLCATVLCAVVAARFISPRELAR